MDDGGIEMEMGMGLMKHEGRNGVLVVLDYHTWRMYTWRSMVQRN